MGGDKIKRGGQMTTPTRAGKIKWVTCKHMLDSTFPQEKIPGFVVGRCKGCACVVALKK